MKTIDDLLGKSILCCLARQLHLTKVLGDSKWSLDLLSGTLSIENRHYWHTQVLGTESHETNTWLWAWANTSSNLLPALIQASLLMKKVGEERNIPELTQPLLPLSAKINGHILSMIASGVCDADAYYRGPYEGGAVFMLIKDDKFPRSLESPLSIIARVFPQAISTFAISDHRLALTSYLEQCGIEYTSAVNTLIVNEGIETVMTATFDELSRLTNLNANLKPHQKK